MKVFAIVILLFMSFGVLASGKPTKKEVIDYLKVTNTLQILEGYSKSYIEVLKKSFPNLREDFYKDPALASLLSEYDTKIIEECALVIQKSISGAELRKIVDFCHTKLGKKIVRLNRKTAPLFLEIGTKTNIWLNSKLTRIIKKYNHCLEC